MPKRGSYPNERDDDAEDQKDVNDFADKKLWSDILISAFYYIEDEHTAKKRYGDSECIDSNL